MGFGYGYPPPPTAPPTHPHALFSPLQHNPNHNPHHHHHSHHHPQHGPTAAAAGPPPPGGAPAPPFGPIHGNPHQPGLSVTQAHGAPMSNLTHSFAPALSPGLSATMLMGHPGPAGPYAGSHLTQSANSAVNGTAIGPSQSGPAPPPPIPGALAMASMNYWPNAASGLTHLSTADFSLTTHLSAGGAPSGTNGFTTTGPEQTSPEGLASSHLTNGNQPSGLCSVFMSPHSATPALGRVHEDAIGGGLLGEFVPCMGVKDPNAGSDGRAPNNLPGLYAPTAPGSTTSSTSGALKLTSGSLRTGSPPPSPSAHVTTAVSTGNGPSASSQPPSSSFVAKQGLKSRYFQKGSSHSTYPSQMHPGPGGRGNRNTVVAVKVGTKEKPAELTNGSRHSAFEVRGKNGNTGSTSPVLDSEENLKTSEKKFKSSAKVKSMDPSWQDMERESVNKDGRSTAEHSPLDSIEQGILDLSLISDAAGQSSSELEIVSSTLETTK
ncbi:unnamed protein product [Echinostoma caproni]|uniref:Bromodomain adjacent to zinc finger domain protein 2A n=1 Tax=Echinostoma caproni TaxID=27848 RepID=A0A183AC84_9TREM|nr:unnamed protein product [Echinostoma caproni]